MHSVRLSFYSSFSLLFWRMKQTKEILLIPLKMQNVGRVLWNPWISVGLFSERLPVMHLNLLYSSTPKWFVAMYNCFGLRTRRSARFHLIRPTNIRSKTFLHFKLSAMADFQIVIQPKYMKLAKKKFQRLMETNINPLLNMFIILCSSVMTMTASCK